MKTLPTLIATLALTAFAAPALAADGWMTDYEKAKKVAKEQDKVILADFTGSDWCGWCIRLKGEVFDKSEFKEWAKSNVVLLELDYPRRKEQDPALKKQNEQLQAKYGITGFPTIIFMDPDGHDLARSGYLQGGPAAWTKDAGEKISRIKAYLGLKNKADKTEAEKVDLLLTELELGVLKLDEAKTRRDEVAGALTPEQSAEVETKLKEIAARQVDEEIMAQVLKDKPESQEDAARFGAGFWKMYQAGKRPHGEEPTQLFYIFIMEHGHTTGSVQIVEAGFKELKAKFGDNPRAGGFLEQQEQRLEALRKKVAGEGEPDGGEAEGTGK